MSAAGVSSLFLQSRLATGITGFIQQHVDSQLPDGPLNALHPHGFAWLMILTTSFTTVAWLTVTMLTKPEPEEKLRAFYRKVLPSKFGWAHIAELEGEDSKQSLLWSAIDWVAGCAMIYFSLFGIGHIIFGRWMLGLAMLIGAALMARFLFWDLNRRGWETLG